MNRSRRSWWTIYGACAAVVLATLVWVTITVVRLEQAEITARTEAAYQESLRLALWRMDSWMSPLLAREAARPYFDYQAFYPQQRAYTSLLYPIEPGEVLTPSPLLSFQSEYFSIHFQVDPNGAFSSPQAPAGSFRGLAEDAYLTGEQIDTNVQELASIDDAVTTDTLMACAVAADTQPAPDVFDQPAAVSNQQLAQSGDGTAQKRWTQQEAQRRKGAYQESLQPPPQAGAPDVPVDVGSLVPFWTNDGDAPRLVFTRRVVVGDRSYFQGFLCNWPKLRGALLARIGDLFADARLAPVLVGPGLVDESGTMLATIPVSLEVPAPIVAAVSAVSPARSTLALTWLAVVAGMIAVAVTLRASIAFGEKRSRFASAVTHELRTPLTTFRMYSEMLADGMVTGSEQRQNYLDTLKAESGRLSNLVENVLAYARLEDGRAPGRPVPTTVGDVLSPAVPHLAQRAEVGGMTLSVENEAPQDTPLVTDVEVVGQILLNLVDNACKYCADAGDRTIHLASRVDDGRLEVCVRDHGPGVGDEHARAIFDPFERGSRSGGDGTPGVGLGLALARGLARDLGGDLVLESSSGDGACFRLSLPVA